VTAPDAAGPAQGVAGGATDPWTPSQVELSRRAVRRSRTVRSVGTAATSTVVVVALLVWAVTSSSGWPAAKATFLDWDKAVSSFPAVLEGLWLNLRIMLVCGVLIGIMGLGIAVMRTLRGAVFFPLRVLATAYTDLFRGLPLLLVVFILGLGVPALQVEGLTNDPLIWGCAAIVLSYAAYVAEVIRAGIESVHPSQRAAARSLGLSHPQTLRFVVIPQAIRRVMPPLLNDLVSLQKDSGLISVLGVTDAIQAAHIEEAADFNFTPYLVAGFLFVCLTVPMARFTDWVARKQGFHGAGGVV
jgi:polar amino acid transport system permease protein